MRIKIKQDSDIDFDDELNENSQSIENIPKEIRKLRTQAYDKAVKNMGNPVVLLKSTGKIEFINLNN